MKTKAFLLVSLICVLLCTSCTSYVYEYDTRPASTYYYSGGVRVYRSLGNVYDSHHHHYHHHYKPAPAHPTYKHKPSKPSNYRPSTNRPTRPSTNHPSSNRRPSSSTHHKPSPSRR